MSPTLEEVCRAILHIYNGEDVRVTKAVLLNQRTEIVQLIGEVLGNNWSMPPPPMVDSLYLDAYRAVLNYEGENTFMKSLRRYVEAGEMLTQKQMESIMGPPFLSDIEVLENHGMDVPLHSWQAREIVNRLRREAYRRAKEEADADRR